MFHSLIPFAFLCREQIPFNFYFQICILGGWCLASLAIRLIIVLTGSAVITHDRYRVRVPI